MKNPIGVLLSSLAFLFFLYIGWIVWLKPKQYIKFIHERRKSMKLQLHFLPDWLIGFGVFYENPQLNIWWARIFISFAIITCVVGFVAAIRGPF